MGIRMFGGAIFRIDEIRRRGGMVMKNYKIIIGLMILGSISRTIVKIMYR